jgi:anaerobic magnesium-protoporphyrin IX monomethyl ester cyclase
MRITMVIPPELASVDKDRVEYLGLGYVAACARGAGHQVDILDCKSQFLDHAAAVARIQALNPQVIGITAPYTLDLTSGVKLSLQLRAAGFDGVIVVGGHPATFSFQKLLRRYPCVDVVVRGEGEATFLELLERLDDRPGWSQVAGIAYLRDGEVMVTAARPLIQDLSSLPFPARDNIDSDGAPTSVVWFKKQDMQPGTMILSSRGCPFRCSYCSVQAFYRTSAGRPWRPRAARDVVEEMTLLAQKWGVRTLRFSDDNFFGSCNEGKARAREIAAILLERNLGITFTIECRVDDIEYSLFSVLKKAGMVRASVGIESGVARMLKSFNKHASVEQNKNGIAILRQLGVECHPNFILVDPETTLTELRENFTFLKETRLYLEPHAMHILYSNRLGLFAGTPSQEMYEKQGRTRPWKAAGVTKEDQEISENIGAVLDYDDLDGEVTKLAGLLNRLSRELSRQDAVLTQLELQLVSHRQPVARPACGAVAPLNGHGMRPMIQRWRANAGKLAFNLFDKALSRAEQGLLQPETAEQHARELLAEIDRYSHLHFGRPVDELQASTAEPVLEEGVGAR